MARALGPLPERVPETDNGLQGDVLAGKYDQMQRHIRDQGWLKEKVDSVVAAGINSGTVLEVGCGPGYLGLEWLSQASSSARLVALDISKAMLDVARANASEYGLLERCAHDLGNVLELPYPDNAFDHAFSAASLHEWANPVGALTEILRVVKPGGRFCISDLRRDIDRTTFQFMKANIAADMRPGFRTSIQASYVCSEVEDLLRGSGITVAQVKDVQMGLVVWGTKEAT